MARVMELGIPLVFFDRCVRGIGATCVSIDDEESARVITHHLIDHGYTRLRTRRSQASSHQPRPCSPDTGAHTREPDLVLDASLTVDRGIA